MTRRPKPPLVLTQRGTTVLALAVGVLFLVAMSIGGWLELTRPIR